MAVEIPIVCQGNNVVAEINEVKTQVNTVQVRVEMVEICGNLLKDNICEITGRNCLLKHKKMFYNEGLGDGDEEIID